MSTITVVMLVLAPSSVPWTSTEAAGAATALPEAAVVEKALLPADSRPAVERTLTSSIRPTTRPAALTLPSVPIVIWSSATPSGIVSVGWIRPPAPLTRRRLPSRCRAPSRVSA
jgi:hypothetical protein